MSIRQRKIDGILLVLEEEIGKLREEKDQRSLKDIDARLKALSERTKEQ